MEWEVEWTDDSRKDLKELDGSLRKQVLQAIKKVKKNPVSIFKNGYGKPLGNKNNVDLTGLYKVVLKKLGIRIVYELVELDGKMTIIVIGARKDEQVYKEAYKRITSQK